MQIAKITELGPAEAHRGLKEMIDGQETMATRAGYLEPRSTRHRPLFSNPLPSLFSLAFSLTGAFSVYRSTSHPRRLCFHFNLHTADHVFRSDSPSSCYPRHASRPSIKPRLFLPPPPLLVTSPLPQNGSRGHWPCRATLMMPRCVPSRTKIPLTRIAPSIDDVVTVRRFLWLGGEDHTVAGRNNGRTVVTWLRGIFF